MHTTWLGVNAARLVTRILVCCGLMFRPFLLRTTWTSPTCRSHKRVLYVPNVLRPFLPCSLGTRVHWSYFCGTWVTRFWIDLSATVFQVRASAKPKPQRRVVSALSRAVTMAILALEP